MPEPPFPQDEEVSPSNPFLEEEEASRRDARPLERALDMLMVTTSRRCPRESDSQSPFWQEVGGMEPRQGVSEVCDLFDSVLFRHVQHHQRPRESGKVLHLQDCLQTRGGHRRHVQLLRGGHPLLTGE